MRINKNFRLISSLSLSFLSFLFSQTYGFGSATHEYVTQTSTQKIVAVCESLNLSKKQKNVLDEIKNSYNPIIVEYSLKPDEDENQGSTYKSHFYNSVTERNFLGEKSTALSKCIEHYSQAIVEYKSGNKEEAYEELGRAIHFLEDANTSVHTGYDTPTDSVLKLPIHVKFEKKCDLIRQECDAEIFPESLEYYKVNNVETLVKASAILAMDNFYRLENVGKKMDDENLPRNAILNAQKNIVGLLYKFVVEVTN